MIVAFGWAMVTLSPQYCFGFSTRPVWGNRRAVVRGTVLKEKTHDEEFFTQQLPKLAISTLASFAILFSSTPDLSTIQQKYHAHSEYRRLGIESVWAADVEIDTEAASEAVVATTATATATATTDAVVPTNDNANDDIVREISSSSESVLEEAWKLVNKYYLDPTYNGQDWKAVKKQYEQSLAKGGDEMALVTQMVGSLGDKYSRVLDRAAYERIQKFDLIGVGATFMPDANKRIIVGAPPVKNSSAEKVHLQVGDVITAVNGLSTEGRTAFDIIDQIIEPNAPTVEMTVFHPADETTRKVTMTRDFVQVKDPISYRVSERRADGTVVGYIRIREFNSLVRPKLLEALKTLERDEHCNAYVLDIRSNPGGAFQSAVELSSFWLPPHSLATNVKDSQHTSIPFYTSDATDMQLIDSSHPLVVWLDKSSASATEVLAGALKDQCRAVTMGSTNSFGKGLIQAVYGLKNGSGLVLTVAKYVTPKGIEIQGTGIPPDIPSSNLPNLFLPPSFGSDTSPVDFTTVNNQLKFCQPPSNL